MVLPVMLYVSGTSPAMSEYAYGACIYLRVETSDGQVSSRLISSKSRVAPIKAQTIPRLELLGAVTAAELWRYASKASDLPGIAAYFWRVSMIALHWLRKDPQSLKQFVYNRVSIIKGITSASKWNHVPGIENPADLLSRGVPAEQLAVSSRWWNGPPWLACNQSGWPSSTLSQLTNDELVSEQTETKKTSFTGAIHSEPNVSLSGQMKTRSKHF